MSRKNKWRRIGVFEIQRVSGRYSDNSLDGRDILWLRSPKIKGAGRAVAYCCTAYRRSPLPDSIWLGLGVYLPAGVQKNPITVAKAMLRDVRSRYAELTKGL